MYIISKSIHIANRMWKQFVIFLSVLGPGIIVMVADNDAGGISTYAVTGSKYGFSLLWMFILLVPMAYYVQEMTVRLGAVTKRGHAEAIFEGFGPFWGWFSLIDLAIVNWLTLITEYIGMTEAMSLFGIPPWITYVVVTIILLAVIVTGSYWTFERMPLFFLRVQSRLYPGCNLGHGGILRAGMGRGPQGLLPSGTARGIHKRSFVHHNGQYRNEHCSLDDILSAKCRG